LPTLVGAGVPVVINSDDPPMFSTTLNNEYVVAAGILGLDPAGIADLARQGVRYSFLDGAGKAAILAEIDGYVATV
jgi:adenosine deaminase/aminodeoxyfutalosine deaminase